MFFLYLILATWSMLEDLRLHIEFQIILSGLQIWLSVIPMYHFTTAKSHKSQLVNLKSGK